MVGWKGNGPNPLMNKAYVTALKLALERDVISDGFVIKRTCKYIDNVLDELFLSDPGIVAEIRDMLEVFLSSQDEVELSIQLDELFINNDVFFVRNYRTYTGNISKLKDLLSRIEGLIA